MRLALESTFDGGVAVIDGDGRHGYVNEALCRLVGFRSDELIGSMRPFPYWPPEDAADLDAFFGVQN